MGGFGGVAEYGITVRWDKNNLKLIRLLLERRDAFQMYGGIRFGGALTLESAFEMGFDHIALCLGAGRPTFIPMKNGLAHGVRQASDFLMGLQLTGAAKADSIANLTVRLPVVVIGGGLTAIDTATEALAYYPGQVEKFLLRYEQLVATFGDDVVSWDAAEVSIVSEFTTHAQAIRAERRAAAAEGRAPRIAQLLQGWGGATIVYRKRLVDAPSYTLNHEEVEKAMQEGIEFAECLAPVGIEVDDHGHAEAITLKRTDTDSPDTMRLSARTVLIAAGTQPNTVLAREDPFKIRLDGKHFAAIDASGLPVSPERSAKPQKAEVFMYRHPDGRLVSFFGDLHPSFAGNVVKAMASATQGYKLITESLRNLDRHPISADLPKAFNGDFRATIHEINRLTPTIIELVIHAPSAARSFRPGQFFRVQNFEAWATTEIGTRLVMEPLALTGAGVDAQRGLISTIVLEMGGSSKLCALFKPGDPVILMGPTGIPTEIAANQTYLLAGGGLGNAVLFSIGQAARENNSRVLYFAAYKREQDRFKVEQIEHASDVVVWCCEEISGFVPSRPQDRVYCGNIIQAMGAYATGTLGETLIPLQEAQHLIAIGSDAMMNAIARARTTSLKPFLNPHHIAIGSINSPMQCMMKEVCGQCLQLHRDPITSAETVVFSCAGQDQALDRVDFDVLRTRLRQNTVHEKLTARWLDLCINAQIPGETARHPETANAR